GQRGGGARGAVGRSCLRGVRKNKFSCFFSLWGWLRFARKKVDGGFLAFSTAARRPAAPPLACTVNIFAPESTADFTACATVLGISWIFRSRKTVRPAATSSRTTAGPSPVKGCRPTLVVNHDSPSLWMTPLVALAVGTASATIRRSRNSCSALGDIGYKNHSLFGQALIGSHCFRGHDIQPDLFHSSVEVEHPGGAVA